MWAIGTSTTGSRMPPRAIPLPSRTISGGSPENSMRGWTGGAAPPCAQTFTWWRAASTTGATETWLTLLVASSMGIEKPKSRSIRGADDTNPWRDTCDAPATSQ